MYDDQLRGKLGAGVISYAQVEEEFMYEDERWSVRIPNRTPCGFEAEINVFGVLKNHENHVRHGVPCGFEGCNLVFVLPIKCNSMHCRNNRHDRIQHDRI